MVVRKDELTVAIYSDNMRKESKQILRRKSLFSSTLFHALLLENKNYTEDSLKASELFVVSGTCNAFRLQVAHSPCSGNWKRQSGNIVVAAFVFPKFGQDTQG